MAIIENGEPKWGRYFRYWPAFIQQIICTCSETLYNSTIYGPYPGYNFPGVDWQAGKGNIAVCDECFKPRWHALYECINPECKALFLKCFYHGNWDPLLPRCYDCLMLETSWRTPVPPVFDKWKWDINKPVDLTNLGTIEEFKI